MFGRHISGEGHYGFCQPQCGQTYIPLSGENDRNRSSKVDSIDSVVFLEELQVILDNPK